MSKCLANSWPTINTAGQMWRSLRALLKKWLIPEVCTVQSILMIRIGYNFDVINTYYKYWQFSYVGRLVFEHQLQTSGVAGQPCVGFKMGLNSSCRLSILLSYCNNLCWTLLESSQAHSTLGRSSSKPLRLLPLSSCRC